LTNNTNGTIHRKDYPERTSSTSGLASYLAVEENEAKLSVIMKRLNSFDDLYKELAPVGSNLKRIEREVDINEKEYLSILHGLNMAPVTTTEFTDVEQSLYHRLSIPCH
jgi:succinoglycan biosynthesis transport protein ExoP